MENQEKKLCINCKFCEIRSCADYSDLHFCFHPNNLSLVNSSPKASPQELRGENSSNIGELFCGVDGKWFEDAPKQIKKPWFSWFSWFLCK